MYTDQSPSHVAGKDDLDSAADQKTPMVEPGTDVPLLDLEVTLHNTFSYKLYELLRRTKLDRPVAISNNDTSHQSLSFALYAGYYLIPSILCPYDCYLYHHTGSDQWCTSD